VFRYVRPEIRRCVGGRDKPFGMHTSFEAEEVAIVAMV
jgi:hypothetical protein